jgi:hypothetical protein
MARPKNSTGVGISDIAFAQNGETEQIIEPSYIPPTEDFSNFDSSVPDKKDGNTIFRLMDKEKKGSVYISTEDYVLNPTTGKMDSIHLLIGEDEIWGSELKKKYGAASFAELLKTSRRESFKFVNRSLLIPNWDEPAINFLRHTRHCVDNKNKERSRFITQYYEYNPAREAEEADKKMALEMEAMEKLFTLDEAKIKKLCIYLGILLTDGLGETKTPQILKRDLGGKIKNDASGFLKLLQDESVEINFLIVKAIRDSKIDTSQVNTTGKIFWATGSLITAANGRQPKIALLELALSNTSAGKEFLEQLKLVTQ